MIDISILFVRFFFYLLCVSYFVSRQRMKDKYWEPRYRNQQCIVTVSFRLGLEIAMKCETDSQHSLSIFMFYTRHIYKHFISIIGHSSKIIFLNLTFAYGFWSSSDEIVKLILLTDIIYFLNTWHKIVIFSWFYFFVLCILLTLLAFKMLSSRNWSTVISVAKHNLW